MSSLPIGEYGLLSDCRSAVAAISDVGLLAEEVDPGGAEMIGNYSQAFSHIGLINAAWAISQAEERSRRPAPVTSAGGS